MHAHKHTHTHTHTDTDADTHARTLAAEINELVGPARVRARERASQGW